MLELCPLQSYVDRLRLRGRELCVCLFHVGPRDDPGIVLVLRQRRGALVGVDGLIEERQLGVERPQLEVVGGELGAERQPRALQITDRGLRRRRSGGDGPPYPPPQIRLPRGTEAHRVVGERPARPAGWARARSRCESPTCSP